MQSGIALSAFFLLKFCDDLLYRSCMLLYCVTWPLWLYLYRVRPNSPKAIEQKVSNAQTRLQSYLPIVKSATVEFHKAQCFFMLSIEVAAQIVVKQGSLNQGTTTLQGLFNNYSLIGSISISGLLPITFTLLSLYTAEIHSWYLIILSICTVAMSVATLFGIGDFNISPSDMGKLASATSTMYPKCGIRDPTTFCLVLPDNSIALTSAKLSQGGVGGSSLLLSLFVLTLLVFDRLRMQNVFGYKYKGFVVERLKAFKLEFEKEGTRAPHVVLHAAVKHRRRIRWAFMECLYAVIWVVYIVLFVKFLKSLTYPGNGAITTPVQAWTFGQIVAITVWAVPLFEFAKLSVGKSWQPLFC